MKKIVIVLPLGLSHSPPFPFDIFEFCSFLCERNMTMLNRGTYNYNFEKRNKEPSMTLENLDAIIMDFSEDKTQLLPTKERFDNWLRSQGIDTNEYLQEKLKRIKKYQNTKI